MENNKIREIAHWVGTVATHLRAEHTKLTAERDAIAKDLQDVEAALASMDKSKPVVTLKVSSKEVTTPVTKTSTRGVKNAKRSARVKQMDGYMLKYISSHQEGVSRKDASDFMATTYNIHKSSIERSFNRLRKSRKIQMMPATAGVGVIYKATKN